MSRVQVQAPGLHFIQSWHRARLLPFYYFFGVRVGGRSWDWDFWLYPTWISFACRFQVGERVLPRWRLGEGVGGSVSCGRRSGRLCMLAGCVGEFLLLALSDQAGADWQIMSGLQKLFGNLVDVKSDYIISGQLSRSRVFPLKYLRSCQEVTTAVFPEKYISKSQIGKICSTRANLRKSNSKQQPYSSNRYQMVDMTLWQLYLNLLRNGGLLQVADFTHYNFKPMDIIKKIRNYTLNERHCLGEGSFGKVYEATSDEGRKVAIKKVDQKLITSDRYLKQSLDNEINIMQKLKHPNIVELYQVITTANNIYLVMQYCSGGDLKRYSSTRKINEDTALNIIKQIVKGFEEMGKFAVIHRDLKPANILVHQEVFKICDFGFAKFFGEAGKMARTFVGTPIYMSPQVLSQKQYTNKTDVWSLGVMLYELLFGKLPYNGYSQQDLFRNIMKGNLHIPQCSKESLHLLQGMLVIEEVNRWNWDEVFQALFSESPKNRVRSNTPVNNNGLFYVNEQRGKEKSNEQRRPEKKEYDVYPKTPPVIANNNYMQNIYEDRMKPEYNRRPQVGKNMLIPQQPKKNNDDLYLIPAQRAEDKAADQNPRFFYFLLVQFIVNPIEASLSFDSFLFTLWKYTILLYQRLLEKPEVVNVQLYRNVLANQLTQIKNLEGEMQVKKEGNLRNLADLVYQQAKGLPFNKKRIVWLKRFIDKRYSYEAID